VTIRQRTCLSFINEIGRGVHNLETDVLKLALYQSSAVLDETTTAYTASGETSGAGYTAGGKIIVRSTGYPMMEGIYLALRIETLTWTDADFDTDGALLYNSSKSDKAIVVLTWGFTRTPRGRPFNLVFPPGAPPLVKIGGY